MLKQELTPCTIVRWFPSEGKTDKPFGFAKLPNGTNIFIHHHNLYCMDWWCDGSGEYTPRFVRHADVSPVREPKTTDRIVGVIGTDNHDRPCLVAWAFDEDYQRALEQCDYRSTLVQVEARLDKGDRIESHTYLVDPHAVCQINEVDSLILECCSGSPIFGYHQGKKWLRCEFAPGYGNTDQAVLIVESLTQSSWPKPKPQVTPDKAKTILSSATRDTVRVSFQERSGGISGWSNTVENKTITWRIGSQIIAIYEWRLFFVPFLEIHETSDNCKTRFEDTDTEELLICGVEGVTTRLERLEVLYHGEYRPFTVELATVRDMTLEEMQFFDQQPFTLTFVTPEHETWLHCQHIPQIGKSHQVVKVLRYF